MSERENHRPRQGQQNQQRRPAQRQAARRNSAASSRSSVTSRTRRSGTSAKTRKTGAKNVKRTKDEYSGFRFLGIMLIVALLICGGIFAVMAIKDKLHSDTVEQTVAEPATARVTFTEGKTVRQYGVLLEENGVCNAEDFYNEMRVTDFTADFSFLPSNEVLQQREYPL